MKTVVDRRETGIPGSDAAEQVKAMGGPIAQRASRPTGSGPVPMTFGSGQKTRSNSAHLDMVEEPLDTDVLPENDGDETWEEWRPHRYSRAEIRRRLAEQNALASQAAPERTTGSRVPARRKTDALPRQRRRFTGWALLLLGALVLIFLYLVIGWLYSAGLGVYNRFAYGPTPTAYLEAVVGNHDAPGHPTWVVAVNEHGTIVIQIAPGGDFSKTTTYTVAAQTFHTWGNPDDVVVTLTVAGTGPAPNILVHLQGDPDISHFYQRPTVAFLLINQRSGFKVGPVIS